MNEDQRLPLQVPKHGAVEPHLEGWPQPRTEPNANAVHPDDPIDPDALLKELRVGPEEVLPIPMPRHEDGHNHADGRGGAVAGAGDGHGTQIAAVATPLVGGEPAAAAPVESAAAAKPAEKPPAATSPSGLPDTIRVTEEGESGGT
jgi:hypothetical protein